MKVHLCLSGIDMFTCPLNCAHVGDLSTGDSQSVAVLGLMLSVRQRVERGSPCLPAHLAPLAMCLPSALCVHPQVSGFSLLHCRRRILSPYDLCLLSLMHFHTAVYWTFLIKKAYFFLKIINKCVHSLLNFLSFRHL